MDQDDGGRHFIFLLEGAAGRRRPAPDRALTNVVKHARATRASVTVGIEAEQLSIHVHDDGSGAADPTRGTGLTGMLDRVEAGDGTLDITSPPGIGTTLHATLPLRERIRPQ